MLYLQIESSVETNVRSGPLKLSTVDPALESSLFPIPVALEIHVRMLVPFFTGRFMDIVSLRL